MEKMISEEQTPPRYPLSGIDILVVGAGVGGLLSALECWRKGHNVRIIESRPAFDPNGDIFSIGPSGLSTMSHWPWMVERIREIGIPATMELRKNNGDLIVGSMSIPYDTPKALEITGGLRPAAVQHRTKFNMVLLEQLRHVGTQVEYGKRVTEYGEKGDKGFVWLEDGSSMEADLIIAADGVHTKSWKLVKGENKTISSGYSIFRTAYDPKPVFENAVIKRFLDEQNVPLPIFQFWYGPHMHASFMLDKSLCSWTLTYRHKGGDPKETWNENVPIERAFEVMDQAEGWSDVFKEVVRTTPENGLVDYGLYFRSPNPQWYSPSGRVVQVGDSAHSFLPTSGSGATQAMEDAISLATCLQIGGKSNIPWAVRIHTKLRFERTACVQKMGFVNRDNIHRADWDEMAKNPSKAKPRMGDWNFKHQPEAYAVNNYGRVLEHLITGAPFENSNTPPGHKFKLWTAEGLLEESENGGIELDGDWFYEEDSQ